MLSGVIALCSWSWFWISEMNNFWQIHKSVQISSVFWFEMDENYGLPVKPKQPIVFFAFCHIELTANSLCFLSYWDDKNFKLYCCTVCCYWISLVLGPTLKILLFPLTRSCFTCMGRSIGKLFFLTPQIRYPLNSIVYSNHSKKKTKIFFFFTAFAVEDGFYS